MKYKFSFVHIINYGTYEPICTLIENSNKNNLVSLYVSDYKLNALDELKDAIRKIELSIEGKIKDALIDISTQVYGAEIRSDFVEIYPNFFNDNDEFIYIKRNELLFILKKWMNFIQQEITNPDHQEIIDSEDVYI